jgi:GNAT superfamily N-acetyltransferase
VTVRAREAGDLPALVTALRAVHERDGYPVTWKADPAAWLTPDGMRAAWVVERGGRPVGHAALAAVGPDEPAAPAWSLATGQPAERLSLLTRLFVTLDARGQGVGLELLDTAVQHAADDGRTAVLEVSPADLPAVALYRRSGWRDAGPGPSRWWVPGGGTSLLLVAPADAGVLGGADR